MVETHEVQQGCVQVVEVHAVVDRLNPVLISGAIAHAALYSSTSQPEAEAGGIVVAAIGFLNMRRASELTTPHHQCVLQETAFLQVREQGSQRLVGLAAVAGEARV